MWESQTCSQSQGQGWEACVSFPHWWVSLHYTHTHTSSRVTAPCVALPKHLVWWAWPNAISAAKNTRGCALRQFCLSQHSTTNRTNLFSPFYHFRQMFSSLCFESHLQFHSRFTPKHFILHFHKTPPCETKNKQRSLIFIKFHPKIFWFWAPAFIWLTTVLCSHLPVVRKDIVDLFFQQSNWGMWVAVTVWLDRLCALLQENVLISLFSSPPPPPLKTIFPLKPASENPYRTRLLREQSNIAEGNGWGRGGGGYRDGFKNIRERKKRCLIRETTRNPRRVCFLSIIPAVIQQMMIKWWGKASWLAIYLDVRCSEPIFSWIIVD